MEVASCELRVARKDPHPNPLPAYRERGNKGFTLLELLLVMGIILLIAAIVAPALKGFAQSRQIHNEAVLMVGVAGFARTQAISQGRTYRLNFDTNQGGFWITFQQEAGSAFEAVPGDAGQRYALPSGVQMTVNANQPMVTQSAPGQAVIVGSNQAAPGSGGSGDLVTTSVSFYSDGRVDPATITLTDTTGTKVVVAAMSATESYAIQTPVGGVQ